PLRSRYAEALAKLEKTSRERKLTADELADLGALYVRLGDPARAVELLHLAQRDHPNHFRICANLGTAWQVHGDLEQAAACWLQADSRLLWQLAELANAHGDIRTAAAIMDGCVTEFGLHTPELRRHRQLLRAAVDQLSGARFKRAATEDAASAKATHQQHTVL